MWQIAIPAAIAGISSLFGKKPDKTTSTTDQTTTGSSSYQNTNTPLWDPETMLGRDVSLQTMIARLMQGPQFMNQYETAGLKNINQGANAKNEIIQNLLASRGLGRTSMGGAALAGVESGRVGDAVNFQNTLPMVADEYQRNNVNDLSRFVSSLPVGNTSSGVSNNTSRTVGTGTNTYQQGADPFGAMGGLASAMAAMAFNKRYGSGS